MEPKRTHLPSLAMFVTSGCGVLLALGAAAFLFIFGFLFLIFSPDIKEQTFMAVATAWESGLVAALALPAALISLFRLLDKPFRLPAVPRWLGSHAVLIGFPLAIGAGYLISMLEGPTWFFLPPLQILAVSIPIIWLISLIGSGLESGSSPRNWKILSFSLIVTNPFIVAVELVLFGIFAIVGGILIFQQPDLVQFLQTTAERIQSSNVDPEAAREIVTRLFQVPGLVAGIFVFVCVIAPLVEEPLKTLAVWFLWKKDLTPAQGLMAGAVCGAAFTLVETLGSINQPFDSLTWVTVLIGRTGTAIMHILTAGLTGWGIARFARSKNFFHALPAYLAAMTLHSLWNFVSLFGGISPFLRLPIIGSGSAEWIGSAGIFLLASLALVYLVGIFLIQLRLKQTNIPGRVNEVK